MIPAFAQGLSGKAHRFQRVDNQDGGELRKHKEDAAS